MSWNTQVIEEFRTNEGRVGGNFEGKDILLLHHTGAKSGKEYVNPLAYQRLDHGSVAIFASKAGAPAHPHWYHNLVAHPDVEVEIGTNRYPMHARLATGEERDKIYAQQVAVWPGFGDYEESTKGIRVIPVVILEPR